MKGKENKRSAKTKDRKVAGSRSDGESLTPRQRGLALLERMLGQKQARATMKGWRAISPDFERYVIEFLAGEIWSRPRLELKIRSLCTITALAALGRQRGLELNVRMALNNGATREEIIESLLHIAPYAGFPACWEALVVADRVFNED